MSITDSESDFLIWRMTKDLTKQKEKIKSDKAPLVNDAK